VFATHFSPVNAVHKRGAARPGGPAFPVAYLIAQSE